MKKFLIASLFVFVLSHPVLAATSHDIQENVYLRQDVFEAKMDAFMAEVKLTNQNVLSEIHRVNDVLSARIDSVNSSLSARIDGVNTRIDDLRNGLYLWLVVIGTFIAWPKAKNFLQQHSAQKQSFTLDDVEKLIDAKLNSKAQ